MADAENPGYEGWNPDTDPQPPIPVVKPHNRGVLSKANSHRSHKDKEPTEKRIREWLQITVNVILVVVGILAVHIYGGQLEVMRGQLGEIVRQYPEIQKQAKAATDAVNQATIESASTKASTAKQIDILQQQARAAQQSLKTARDSFRLDERPWIFVNRFEMPSEPQVGQDFKVKVFVVNTGKTPAFRVMTLSQINMQFVEPSPPDFANRPAPKGIGTIVPGKLDYNYETEPFSITPVLLQYYDMRSTHIYVFGKFYYLDAFGFQHWTTFCMEHTYGDPLNQFGFCVNGNDIDREAEQK
jgi:hypothetical protein